MAITNVGPWILLGIGTLLMLAAVYIAVSQQRRPSLLLIFGFLSIGVGIHGPLFMGPYAKFLNSISSMVKNPSPATYSEIFSAIGKGEFGPELQEIALSYALDRPIGDMDRLLRDAIARAADSQGRQALEVAERELTQKANLAAELVNQHMVAQAQVTLRTLDTEKIEALDPATRMIFSKELLSRQDKLNPGGAASTLPSEKLEQWALPRAMRVYQVRPK